MLEWIVNVVLCQKVMSVDDVVVFIYDGDQIGFGGFIGLGYFKEFLGVLIKCI